MREPCGPIRPSSLSDRGGDAGSLVSWNKKFEMACNSAMAGMFPDLAEFLGELNRRTVDLMDVFKEDYVDAAFLGPTSIKKVLPVLCPELKYNKNRPEERRVGKKCVNTV